MELLPPVGWADVATKQDLAALEQRMDLRFATMDAKFEARLAKGLGDLRTELQAAMRSQTWAIVVALGVAIFVSEVLSRIG